MSAHRIVTFVVTISETIMITRDRTSDQTCIRTSDRNLLVTMCQFVSMFAKARCARCKPQQFKNLRRCRKWRERPESHKTTQTWLSAIGGQSGDTGHNRQFRSFALVLLFLPLLRSHDTTETDVRSATVRRTTHAGARAVVKAETDATEERTAAVHALRRPHSWVKAFSRPRGVDIHNASGSAGIRVGQVPVSGPLPDVAGHVIQAEAIGREGFDRRGAGIAVFACVLVGKMTLEVVALWVILVERCVAPDIF